MSKILEDFFYRIYLVYITKKKHKKTTTTTTTNNPTLYLKVKDPLLEPCDCLPVKLLQLDKD